VSRHGNVIFTPEPGAFQAVNGLEELAMKALMALALVLALGATAQAKLTPLEPRPVPVSSNDYEMFAGPAGAMLESDYFRAPEPRPAAAGTLFPCRAQVWLFDKTRVAQSCH
jgi:hypothetical protein